MNEGNIEDLIHAFVLEKEQFLNQLRNDSNDEFSIQDIYDYMELRNLKFKKQDDIFEFLSKMVELDLLEKKKASFSFISKKIDSYIKGHTSIYTRKEESKILIRDAALRSKKDLKELVLKSEELIDNYDKMGNTPLIISNVAFNISNSLLNQNFHKSNILNPLSDKDQTLVKYWIHQFEQNYFENLFKIEDAKSIIDSINRVGDKKINKNIKEFAKSILDTPLRKSFGINIRLAVGLALIIASFKSAYIIDYRDLCEVLNINTGEFLKKWYENVKSLMLFNIRKGLKKDLNFKHLYEMEIIRRGDHLTFNIEKPKTEDAEVIDNENIIYHNNKMTLEIWVYKQTSAMKISDVTYRYIFHREIGLSLKNLIDIVSFSSTL